LNREKNSKEIDKRADLKSPWPKDFGTETNSGSGLTFSTGIVS